MRPSERNDALAIVAMAAVLLAAVVVSQAGRWLDGVAELARSPLVPVLAGVCCAGLVALLLARVIATRRALSRRVSVVLVPADSFDPDPEAVMRLAAGLTRARRLRDLLAPRACAVRIRLDADPNGMLRYAIELPAHARAALGTALAAYDAIELRDADPEEERRGEDAGQVARAELVLARSSAAPLRDAGIDPDPLAGFAAALAPLHGDERAEVCVDLLPLGPARRRRVRRRILRAARREENGGPLTAIGETLDDRRGRLDRSLSAGVERRAGQRALTRKLGAPEPLFQLQVLVCASSPARGRAVTHVGGLVAAFEQFAGENHFRVSGLRLPGGSYLGADMPWRRRGFDRRAATGLFRPVRRRIVTATEIAGLLKPPSARCGASNVLRSGGVIPPPPRDLDTFTEHRRDLLPLGRVRDRDGGERIVGVPLRETVFTYMAGRSRFGKTETGIGQFLHLARSGHGCFFLDPHEDAIHRIKHYLTDRERARVIELNVADQPGERQLGWNLFAVNSREPGQRVDAIVDAFASALHWDENNTRALNLTTQAAQALVALAAKLPRRLAPTIFQIPTLLSDEQWRAAVLPHAPAPTRQFFTERFPRLSAEAITPVTNLIDRLRMAPAVATVLGNPVSHYDVRAAMDERRIVLACPGSGSTRDRLVANFLVYDLLHAAKTRAALHPSKRRPFYVFLDEVQTYDGASSGNLAALLEQTAKYGIRAFLFNQNPERLTPATLNAVTTNRSHLLTTALNAKAAALLAREWGGQIEPAVITDLQRYTYLASITRNGAASRPFLVHGLPAEELFEPQRESLDREASRHGDPVEQTTAQLDRHDQEIADFLASLNGGEAPARPPRVSIEGRP